MNGVLLSAGFGTRLYPLIKNQPKALLKVNERPILDYLMDQLVEWEELRALHLVSNARMYGHFYRWAQRWTDKLERNGCTFHLHSNGKLDAEERPGAVGDLASVLRRVDASRGVWVSATDSIFRFDLHPLIERYQESGQTEVLALHQPKTQRLRDQSVLQLEDDRVLGVVDQPHDPPTEWICPAAYIFSPDVVDALERYVGSGKNLDSLGAFINDLANEQTVRAWRVPEDEAPSSYSASDVRFHINTRYQYRKANRVLESEPLMKYDVVRQEG